nr:RNA-dependent RNA polymerase [Armillaria gallica partitivirus 1]
MTRDRIVRKAMFQYMQPHEVESITTEFRRSESTPDAVDADFMSYDQPRHPVPRDQHYLKALRKTEQLFRPTHRLKPVHFPDQRYYPWELAVSAEYPYNVSNWYDAYANRLKREGLNPDNRKSFHNFYDKIFTDNRLLIHKIKDRDDEFFDDQGIPKPYGFTNLHARAHVVHDDEPDKIRAVFGVPKLLLQAEQHFIWPLQAYYLNEASDHPLLWGNEMMTGGWRRLNRLIYNGRTVNTVLSLDWSQFDKRALHEIIDDTHNIWRSYFTFNDGYVPTSFYPNAKTETERIENLWEWMTYNVKHYPIRLSDGTLYKWRFNGIASGFQQTQLLDSFVNTIMILTCLSRLGVNINSKDFFIKVQGDDSLICLPEQIYASQGIGFLQQIRDTAAEYFNAKLNDKKSQISDTTHNVKVLGYSNHYGIPYREDSDLLSHLFFPERSYSLPALMSTAIGIAYASCGCSSRVYNICKNIYDFLRDKLNVEPHELGVRWLFRAGLITYESWAEINMGEFPTMLKLQALSLGYPDRTFRAKERLWPTNYESKNGFYFLPYS